MKQRLGFVTNSSSSSFIAKIKKEDKSDYYSEENYAIRNIKSLLDYDNIVFGAHIAIVYDKEDLQDILCREEYEPIKSLLNNYIMENTDRSFKTEDDVISEIKETLEDYNYVLIDADRSCISGAFKDLVDNYIESTKIGESVYHYCE